jgi:hypothetical protein
VHGGIANSNILKCTFGGMLTLGKNDFDVTEGFRSQCFDAMGTEWSELTARINRMVWFCTWAARL